MERSTVQDTETLTPTLTRIQKIDALERELAVTLRIIEETNELIQQAKIDRDILEEQIRQHVSVLRIGKPEVRVRLTLRERAILEMIVTGCRNKDIAAAFNISERTAKFHVSNILRKTNTKDKFQLQARVLNGTVNSYD